MRKVWTRGHATTAASPPYPQPPPGGRGDPRSGRAAPAAPGGRRAAQAHQPRASGTGHWQGQPGGRATDGGTAGRGWGRAPQGTEPLHPHSPPGSPLELGLLQKGAASTGTRAAARHSSTAGRGEGGSGDKGAWGPGVQRPHPHSAHRHHRGHEGLLHVDTEHPPTTRWEGYYSSSVHFTEDETEALKSETGHLVKLKSGFKPQSMALSPIHIPQLLAQTASFQRPSRIPTKWLSCNRPQDPTPLPSVAPTLWGSPASSGRGTSGLATHRRAHTAALPTIKETSSKRRKPGDAENMAEAQRHAAPLRENHSAQPRASPSSP